MVCAPDIWQDPGWYGHNAQHHVDQAASAIWLLYFSLPADLHSPPSCENLRRWLSIQARGPEFRSPSSQGKSRVCVVTDTCEQRLEKGTGWLLGLKQATALGSVWDCVSVDRVEKPIVKSLRATLRLPHSVPWHLCMSLLPLDTLPSFYF